jgi:hypothetical protein
LLQRSNSSFDCLISISVHRLLQQWFANDSWRTYCDAPKKQADCASAAAAAAAANASGFQVVIPGTEGI